MAKYRKLGRTSAQRKALLRNQVTAVINNGKIVTTEAKAKEVQKIVDGLIALAVKEKDNFETVKVTTKVARKDKDGKRVKQIVDKETGKVLAESHRDKDGKLFTGNTFPKSDITLYASWREADDISKATTDWSKDVIIDFEDTDKAKAFYEDGKNCYHPSNGVFVMENDPENAHSGNNYFRYYQCGHWMEQYLRGMKLYDPNTAGNQVYLAPNSVYKVSFWLNIEDVGAGNLYLAVFPNKDNLTDWTVANENYITDTNQFENFGKWVLYENTVVTGDDEDGDGVAGTLGFVLYGGYLTAILQLQSCAR